MVAHRLFSGARIVRAQARQNFCVLLDQQVERRYIRQTQVAAWMMFLRGHADDGARYEISDPLASRLKALAASAQSEPQALMEALLSVHEVFPADLAALPEFRNPLRHALQLLHENGARGAIAALQ